MGAQVRLRRSLAVVTVLVMSAALTVVAVIRAGAALAVATPDTTGSYYVTDLTASYWYDLGCKLGTADYNRAGTQNRLVILEFGHPDIDGSTYGVHGYSGRFETRPQIAVAADNFASAYFYGTSSDTASFITLALAENNEGSQVVTNATQQGRAWSNFVNEVTADTANYAKQVLVEGGYDTEVGFNDGTPSLAMQQGFFSINNFRTYDIGDAGGCPSSGRANCVSGGHTWTLDQRYQAAWGLPGAFSVPEIYTTSGSQAAEWGNLTRYASHQYSNPIFFSGVLTQSQACHDRGCDPTTDNSPSAGYNQLYSQMAQESGTSGAPRWSDDIRWEEDICPGSQC